MVGDPIDVQKVRRNRAPAALAERNQPLGIRVGRGADDLWVRLLKRLRQHRDRARDGEELALVGEVILGPGLLHDLELFEEEVA